MEPNYRICRDCSTRNRLDKEFCVKCGEPLEGIVAGDPEATTEISRATEPKKAKASFFVADHENKSPIIAALLGIAAIAVLFGAWRVLREGAPAALPQQPVRSILAPATPLPATTLKSPDPGVSEYSAGVAALRAANYPLAVTLLGAATEAVPTNPEYRLVLADALEKSGATAAALAAYEAAAGLGPGIARYTTEWAKALNRAGRIQDAIRVYELALRIDPQNLPSLREVASLLMKSNNLARARPHLEKVVVLQPDDLLPKQDLARVLEAANELDGAVDQYKKILAAMPGAEVSRALLSEVYMKANRSAEALSTIQEGLALNPSSASLFREKGRIYDRLGDNAQAIAAYREYLRVAPTGPDARVLTDRIAQLSAATTQ